MCHSDASRPPAAPGAVPAASDGPLELRATDGTRVLAHEARPADPSGVGIVILPDVRGLHDYYRQLAVRFAETGSEAAAVDYFGRTAEDDDRSGGGYSWRQSADTAGLTGCIGFYGRPSLVTDAVDRMAAPLLMLIAGADANLPPADSEALAAAAGARVPVELVVFDGAPHSFFDRSFAEHEAHCVRAWDEIRRFVS